MSTLQDLVVEIGVDDSGVARGGGQVESRFERIWGRVQATAAIAGAAVGAAVMASIGEALEAESFTSKLEGQLGLTAADADRLGGVAGDLYADAWGQSMGEVSDAVDAVVSSIDGMRSASTEAVEDMTTRALALGDAFGLDVARAAQVAGQAVASGLARDGTHAMDLLTASMQKVPKAVREDILDAVDEYGPMMSSIGITGERAFSMLVAASEKGAFGIDKTGDALKEFTLLATDMSPASKEAFDAIGLSQEQMAGKLLAGGETGAKAFQQIVDGLRGIKDPVEQSQAALALFGTPLEDLNVSEIPKFLDQMSATTDVLGDVDGASGKLADTLGDNTAASLESLKRGAQQALGEELHKALPTIKSVAEWLGKHRDIVVPLVYTLGAFALAVGAVSLAMKAWAGVQVLANAATATWNVVSKAAKVGTVVWTGVQWLLNASMMGFPLVWIIAAVIAVIAIVYLLVKHWDTVVAWLGKAWDWVKEKALSIWGSIKQFLYDTWAGIVALVLGAIAKVKDIFFRFHPLGIIIANWGKITGWVESQWNAVTGKVQRAVEKIKGFFSGMWGGVSNGLRAALNGAIGLINGGIGSINSMISGANRVPGVSIPFIPNIAYLAAGGIVTGPTLAMIGEGRHDEAVIPLPRGMRGGGLGGPTVLELRSGGSRLDDLLVEILADAVRARGGDVQVVLGAA